MEHFIDRQVVYIPAQTAGVLHQWHNLVYMDLDQQYPERHQLDIYLPNDGVGPFPVIVDVFGGGLYFGAKSSHKLEPALKLLQQGYAVISLNYSLIWQADFPQQIWEIKAAIRWLRAHAAEYQLDSKRFALMGESSGAHLALLAATTANTTDFDKRVFGSNGTESEAVSAIIAMYGPYEFNQFQDQFAASGVTPKYQETGQGISFEGQLFGGNAPRERLDLVRRYNPVNYFSEKTPPILAFVGTKDPVVPYQQTINMITAARAVLGEERADLIVVPGGVHGPADYMTLENTMIKTSFLEAWV